MKELIKHTPMMLDLHLPTQEKKFFMKVSRDEAKYGSRLHMEVVIRHSTPKEILSFASEVAKTHKIYAAEILELAVKNNKLKPEEVSKQFYKLATSAFIPEDQNSPQSGIPYVTHIIRSGLESKALTGSKLAIFRKIANSLPESRKHESEDLLEATKAEIQQPQEPQYYIEKARKLASKGYYDIAAENIIEGVKTGAIENKSLSKTLVRLTKLASKQNKHEQANTILEMGIGIKVIGRGHGQIFDHVFKNAEKDQYREDQASKALALGVKAKAFKPKKVSSKFIKLIEKSKGHHQIINSILFHGIRSGILRKKHDSLVLESALNALEDGLYDRGIEILHQGVKLHLKNKNLEGAMKFANEIMRFNETGMANPTLALALESIYNNRRGIKTI